ncbi:MAG: SGNH/GDSL hydrolase family protein [Planctomycetota bacterium]
MNPNSTPKRTRSSLLVLAILVGTAAPGLGQQPDLSRMVFVGDSLTAGFQNGSLHEDYQPDGYAKLIAEQARVSLPLPSILAPGIPNTLILIDPGPPPVLGQAGGVSAGRVDPFLQAMNLAVPGHDTLDALITRPDFLFDDLTDLVLGLPGVFLGISRSQVEWAEALDPTVVVVWLGSNDTLGAALAADATLVTPPAVFAAAFQEVMARMSATGALLVVANVPDVATIPFLTSTEEVAELLGLPLDLIAALLGIVPGDFVVPDAFPLIGEILTGLSSGPLPPHVVLDAGEVALIRAATATFNSIIAQEASARNAVFVDIHSFLSQLDTQGSVVNGQRLNTSFLGGIFSLDGIHPTNTGYALVANEFIHAMNSQAAAGIPPVNVVQVMRDDPLVLPGVGHPPASSAALAGPAAAVLRGILGGH